MPRTTHGFTPTAPTLVFVLLCVDILKVTQTIEPEKDARLRHHPSILRDPDETPEDPDAPDNGDRSPAEGVVNELESRLFKGRKVMVFAGLSLAALASLLLLRPRAAPAVAAAAND